VCRSHATEQERLKAWVSETLACSTRETGAWIAGHAALTPKAASGWLRCCIEYRKPTAISRKLDPVKQAPFIKTYQDLLNQLSADELVMFDDAVHLTHAVRPVGCSSTKEVRVAVEQSSGRDRLNVHGAIDLETGKTAMRNVLTVDAVSTIMLLMAIEAMYPGKRLVHPSWTTPDTITRSWCRHGWRRRNAGSSFTSSRLLPTSQPNRTTTGDAQAHHPQQMLRPL
jgi:hypothetical protein